MVVAIGTGCSSRAKWPASRRWSCGLRNVPEIGLRARHDEGRIVPAPDDERRRPAGPEVALRGGVGVDVRLVVLEQVDLDLPVLRRGEEREIVDPRVPLPPGTGDVAQVLAIADSLGADHRLELREIACDRSSCARRKNALRASVSPSR
jgi:hypothetical protein